MLSPVDLALIAENRLFHSVPLEDMAELTAHCQRMEVAKGVRLLAPGQPNDQLFLVLSGELRVYPGGEEVLEHASLRCGDCAGEMSLVNGQGASALVIAAEETQLVVLPHATLWAMVDRSHAVARNLLTMLAGRMRNNSLALVSGNSLEFERADSVDPLTGLYNRRWMGESFPRLFDRCEQDGAPLCLLLADIDSLHRINDQYGYLAGDAVLRSVAKELKEGLRPKDLLARHGGEEFAMLLPDTITDNGLAVAERLRVAIAASPLRLDNQRVDSVTLSCGVAPLNVAEDFEGLLTAAHEALQEAKRKGCNRVELAV